MNSSTYVSLQHSILKYSKICLLNQLQDVALFDKKIFNLQWIYLQKTLEEICGIYKTAYSLLFSSAPTTWKRAKFEI